MPLKMFIAPHHLLHVLAIIFFPLCGSFVVSLHWFIMMKFFQKSVCVCLCGVMCVKQNKSCILGAHHSKVLIDSL